MVLTSHLPARSCVSCLTLAAALTLLAGFSGTARAQAVQPQPAAAAGSASAPVPATMAATPAPAAPVSSAPPTAAPSRLTAPVPHAKGAMMGPELNVTFMDRVRHYLFKTDQSADPSRTLHAPFVHPEDMKTPTADAMGLPYQVTGQENTVQDLSQPHRDEDQVGNWVTGKVSEALNTSGSQWDAHVKNLQPVLSKAAVDDYVNFMQQTRIIDRLKSNNQKVHSFVEQKPLLLNQGVVDGTYHWLYEMPATLTFMPETVKDYENTNVEDASNYRIIVRVQVGRSSAAGSSDGLVLPEDAGAAPDIQINDSPDGTGDAGLVIESWEVRKNVLAQ